MRPPDPTRSDLIVLSHLRWNFVWQRPQHLISRMANARRTWFVEEPLPSGGVERPILRSAETDGITRVWLEVPTGAHHLDFGDPGTECYATALGELLEDATSPWVWMYTPMALEIAQQMRPSLLIYDVMDDLAAFKNASATMVLRQHQAIAVADVVFAGGRSLFEKVRKHRDETAYLFPSGVEPEHYACARAHKMRHERPVAGYVGVIDERLDLELIDGLARVLPDWDVHLVGPVAKLEGVPLPDRPNIKWFGQQRYEDLPRLMGGFDVALMPFALNASTRSISPTKTLEYLAAGLPVVSTRIPDVVTDYASVVDLQDDADGFARACRNVYDHSLEERDLKIDPLLRFHHWDSVAPRMEELIAAAAESQVVSESVTPIVLDDDARSSAAPG
ncbi:MAG TPA: glycosyltransferase [Actinomycetota bacterium]|nr:glycosyltransferase [Actinomycetota bacterium]